MSQSLNDKLDKVKAHKDTSKLKVLLSELLCAVKKEESDSSFIYKLINDLGPNVILLVRCKSEVISREHGTLSLQEISDSCDSLYHTITTLSSILEYINTLTISCTALFLTTVFKVITLVLQLCKAIESDCSDTKNELISVITSLFKSIVNLLKVSTGLIELTDFSLLVEERKFQLIFDVIDGLCEVGVVTLQFDPALILLSWKPLGKMLCSLKDHAHLWEDNETILQHVIHEMCSSMLIKGQHCIASINTEIDSVCSKLLKLCRFFATLLVRVIQDYEMYHCWLSEIVFPFLLELLSYLPPSPTSPSNINNKISPQLDANILIICEPLLLSFKNNSSFLHLLTTPSDMTLKFPYSWCWLLCCLLRAMHKLEVQSLHYLYEPLSAQKNNCNSNRLLNAVFECTRTCYIHFSVPVMISSPVVGATPQLITLYEYWLIHVCSGIITLIPAVYYSALEVTLLKELCSNDYYSSLLAVDMWSFLSRWGSSDLCMHHVQLLAQLVLSLPFTALHVKILFKRLFTFLTPQQQISFIKDYSPAVNTLNLWVHVPVDTVSHLKEGIELINILIEQCCSLISVDGQFLHCIINSLQCIHVMLADNTCKPHLLPRLPIDHLISLLVMTINKSEHDCALLSYHLLNVFGLLIDTLTSQQITKVLSCCYWLVCGDKSTVVGVASMLSCCGVVTDPALKPLLCSVFHHLLNFELPWLLKDVIFESFKKFAESTPFNDVLEECVPSHLSTCIIDYIEKVPVSSRKCPEVLQLTNIIKLLNEEPQSCVMFNEKEKEKKDHHSHPNSHQLLLVEQIKDSWSQLVLTHPSVTIIEQLKPLAEQIIASLH